MLKALYKVTIKNAIQNNNYTRLNFCTAIVFIFEEDADKNK